MADQRRAGTLYLKAQGVTLDAKGEFEYSLGGVKRTAIMGANGVVHGFKEETIVPYVEGAITDRGSLDLAALAAQTDITVTLELANGKVVALNSAWWAAETVVNTSEAEIKVRWEGKSAKEVLAS